MLQPGFITAEQVERRRDAGDQEDAGKSRELVQQVRFEPFHEGWRRR